MTRPDWLATVLREARVRPGLVLFGNTRDRFHGGTGARYVDLATCLLEHLGDTGDFTIRATWDRVDRLRFASDPEQRRWDDAVRSAAGPALSGQAYAIGDAPRQPGATATALSEVLARYRQLLDDRDERVLLILDWSHLLVTHAAHPDAGDREWLLQLGKALVGEPETHLDSDQLATRGVLVVLTATLGALPPVLYQGESRVRLVPVPEPGRSERRAFFARHADDLRVATPRGAKPVLASAVANHTEGLTTTDLQQVLMLSRTTPESLTPERLLNLYRLGDHRSPWEELSEDRVQRAAEILGERVKGQDSAVERVATMVVRAWLGLSGLEHSARRTKPKGTLFLVGPTGVGKTELAKATAALLFGDESACLRFDMSEYNHEHSDQRLVGAPPGYVGFEEGGQLTNAVRKRPFSVLLFDEIEKAHPRVLDKFLQILEDGRLTDGRGETTWFSETVILFTSNLGAAVAPADSSPAAYDSHFRSAVEAHFVRELGRPELLNRLGDNIAVFAPIRDRQVRAAILARKLAHLRAHLQERWGAGLSLEPEAEDLLIRAARVDHGGRGLVNAVERMLVNPLAHFLLGRRHQLRRGRCIQVERDGDALAFDVAEHPCT